MVAFFTSVLVSIVLFGGGIWYTKHRPPSNKGTWGECMVGATYVFLTLFWCFGVVPHQWIVYADSGLGWRVDLRVASARDVSGRVSSLTMPWHRVDCPDAGRRHTARCRGSHPRTERRAQWIPRPF